MLGIIDYGSGNIFAFQSIYKGLNVPHIIIDSEEDFSVCSHIILPGVGDYDETLRLLAKKGYIELLEKYVIEEGRYFLGVCVGMQILGTKSEEGNLPGLNWIPGNIQAIRPEENNIRLPHMGWNSLSVVKDSQLIEGINNEEGAYFLHNYEFKPNDKGVIIANAEYGKDIVSVINIDNIFGVQFHPEKSLNNGTRLLKNFSNL
ncbi:imidazole glycerol phosphate synthase subunit HisH [Gammaproteobacteria bacterium]|nr:imidazole glycerol phosphate synthase subunit HisH [Gammaproteobacteria bacterium]